MEVAVLRPRTHRVFPGNATLQRGFEAGLEPGVPRRRALTPDIRHGYLEQQGDRHEHVSRHWL